jgi:hypothetical protein
MTMTQTPSLILCQVLSLALVLLLSFETNESIHNTNCAA